jgi:hypothetical protein
MLQLLKLVLNQLVLLAMVVQLGHLLGLSGLSLADLLFEQLGCTLNLVKPLNLNLFVAGNPIEIRTYCFDARLQLLGVDQKLLDVVLLGN